uniref:EF-hand domain-containing protein n=1 Tax=Alexandrium andersonii TaxID=327968 RepID=A0A7S2MFW7_9DINO|mmetsp:Transcript_67965/g.152264  ORF Transcript_67965/g.152264 Transcript_67965/m.152264 type:complete len:117 (+) Transcript_67965:62-412(+)
MGCGALSARRVELSEEASRKVTELFEKMDADSDDTVTLAEAKAYFNGNFGKLSAIAMFSEVDNNNDKSITKAEFLMFWRQVKKSGYKEDEIIEEVTKMLNGANWVDWNDDRDTGNA